MKMYPIVARLFGMVNNDHVANYTYVNRDFKVRARATAPKDALIVLTKQDYKTWIKTANENSKIKKDQKAKEEKKYNALTKSKVTSLLADTIAHNVKALNIPVEFEDSWYPTKDIVKLLEIGSPFYDTTRIISEFGMSQLTPESYERTIRNLGERKSLLSSLLHGFQNYRGGKLRTYAEWKALGATPKKGSAITSISYSDKAKEMVCTRKHEEDMVFGGDNRITEPEYPDLWVTPEAVTLLTMNMYHLLHEKTGLESQEIANKSMYTTKDLKGLLYKYSHAVATALEKNIDENLKEIRINNIAAGVTYTLCNKLGIERDSRDLSYLQQYLSSSFTHDIQTDLKAIEHLSKQIGKDLDNVIKKTKALQWKNFEVELENQNEIFTKIGLHHYLTVPRELEDYLIRNYSEYESGRIVSASGEIKNLTMYSQSELFQYRSEDADYFLIIPDFEMEKIQCDLAHQSYQLLLEENKNILAEEYLSPYGVCDRNNEEDKNKNHFINHSGKIAAMLLSSMAPVFIVSNIKEYLSEIDFEKSVIIEITEDETGCLNRQGIYYSMEEFQKDLDAGVEKGLLKFPEDKKLISGTLHMDITGGIRYSREFEFVPSAGVTLNMQLFIEHGQTVELFSPEALKSLKLDEFTVNDKQQILRLISYGDELQTMRETAIPDLEFEKELEITI